ncbi:MAG: hypothetical protein EXS50_02485 [Candidatus Taylorbacteria bacterium]|nr:hypothetical protein [Candidatus Taylorbacteria bacterium]
MIKIDQQLIEKLIALKTPAIIAISGFGGAGKSTFASSLGSMINAPIICVDQFGIDRTIENFSHWKGMDFERLEKEILIPFSNGANPVSYGHWDHDANKIIKNVEVPHSRFLIIEGVGLLRPELLKYFSYKIWIDCSQDIANERGKKRDREVHKNPQDEKWDGPWKRNDEEYYNSYKPKDIADLIISNQYLQK